MYIVTNKSQKNVFLKVFLYSGVPGLMQQKQTLHVKTYQSGLEDLLESPDNYTSRDIITKVLTINQYKMS